MDIGLPTRCAVQMTTRGVYGIETQALVANGAIVARVGKVHVHGTAQFDCGLMIANAAIDSVSSHFPFLDRAGI
ncbi:MAG: hypothetical protein EBR50_07675 [Proteobacteria bacterium]|nr:hypothetical protein [Pseudomonadota bacterium]